MAKPRILIADPDVNYIFPLQLKFAEKFFNKVDLEIITDEAYFEALLSTPQRADILIVSESLYSQAIHRHNISHIFLMTEQQEQGQTAELNLTSIFKYTSIKEIFNEIIGKSAASLNIKKDGTQDTQVLLVYSACGGTGKTTVAVGIAASLTKNYKRVLYINAAYMQVFHHMLENHSSIAAPEVYAKLSNPSQNVYMETKYVIRKEAFSYYPPFKTSLMSLGLKYSVYERLIQAAKANKEFDFIVVDAESTFDEDKASLFNLADRIIVVTKQNMSSVLATNLLVSNINGISSDKYIFVCNDFDKEKDNALISPTIAVKFSINEYIDHFPQYEQMKPTDFSKESSVQRAAFLVI